MSTGVKSALGIDITETRISTALLKKTTKGFRVLDAAQFPLLEGTFAQGRLANVSLLLSVLRAAKGRNQTRTKHVAISLPPWSAITRVVRLDEDDPQRIGQYVRNEIKEYAALSGREVVSDFRVLTPSRLNTPGKILIAATDNQLATAALAACRRVRLGISAIEPASLACLRVVGDAVSASRSDERTLLAVFRGGVLNLALTRHGVLEFVRSEKIGTIHDGLEEMRSSITDEINAIIQFYRHESTEATGSWRVLVLDEEDAVVADETADFLRTNIAADTVDIRTTINCSPALRVAPEMAGLASMTAVGLAMRFLLEEEATPGVSLLPPEALRARSARRSILLTANALAAFMVVVILIVGGLRLMTKRAIRDIAALRQAELKQGQMTLSAAARQLAYIKQRSELLIEEMASLRRIPASHVDVPWTELLSDIKGATPEVLCVTQLRVNVTSDLLLEGLSHSYEAVHLFVEMLNRSEHISKATILETARDTATSELVRYTIRCAAIPRRSS